MFKSIGLTGTCEGYEVEEPGPEDPASLVSVPTVELLMAQLAGEDISQQMLVAPTLVVRQSSALPPG